MLSLSYDVDQASGGKKLRRRNSRKTEAWSSDEPQTQVGLLMRLCCVLIKQNKEQSKH
jgi:hypothetical protein